MPLRKAGGALGLEEGEGKILSQQEQEQRSRRRGRRGSSKVEAGDD